MAGFTDLVLVAQPALAGGGCFHEVTAGATWRFPFTGLVDSAGAAVDLTAVPGTCTVYDGATTVVTLTVTGSSGGFTVTKAKADTANLNAGADRRQCKWELYFDNGTERLWCWNKDNSLFTIKAGS